MQIAMTFDLDFALKRKGGSDLLDVMLAYDAIWFTTYSQIFRGPKGTECFHSKVTFGCLYPALKGIVWIF